MTLHIFNPEHDLALAAGLSNFTAPHAGRQLRHDLGFLPALWAQAGDVVLADDPKQAEAALRKLKVATRPVTFVSPAGLARLSAPYGIEPWGWDSALRAMLVRKGVPPALMPADAQLDDVRMLSRRSEAAWLLDRLRRKAADTEWSEALIGESYECTTPDEVFRLLGQYGALVLKAPWSSSGRGLQFVSARRPTPHAAPGRETFATGAMHDSPMFNVQRFNHIVEAQGSMMVEPCYGKVRDLGMEFWSDGEGGVSYEGLSLFHTANGAYTGNVIADEAAKRQVVSRQLHLALLDWVQAQIVTLMGSRLKGRYRGPFGVDMMVVNNPATGSHHLSPSPDSQARFTLHPCVEINLRRTMGHVALALNALMNPDGDDELCRIMRIDYVATRPLSEQSTSKIYKLKINRL